MKIQSVDIYNVSLWENWPHWNPVIVRINTDEGIYGLGEVALAYGTGSSAGVGMVKDMAERHLLGQNPFQIEKIWNDLFRRTFWGQGGGPVVYGAMSAIDEALWDIKGKALSVPVYELLGGKTQDSLRVYANDWYATINDDGTGRTNCNTPEEYAEAALKVVSDGFDAMKFDPFAVRPNGEWDYSLRTLSRDQADLAYDRVAAVREAIGPDVDILVEVHGNLGTTSAIQIGQRLEALDPFFYEEPVDAMNVECMRKVGENVNIPIAAGERLYTRYGFREYIEQQVTDILQPDIGLAGGITELKKIASFAETYDLHVQPHNCAGPIATAAAVQLDACITNFIIQEWFPYRDPRFYDLVEEDLDTKTVNSYYTLTDKPGLGITLNEEVISRYDCVHVE